MVDLNSALEFYAPTFKVEFAKGGKLPKDDIISIEVDEALESPGKFTISLSEVIDIKTQKFKYLDDDRLNPGTKNLLSFGYAGSVGKQSLMGGRIKALTPNFLSTGTQTLSVEGYDLSHDLQKTQGPLSYTEKTYSQVVQEIAQENGLDASGIESTQITHPQIERQRNEKDYPFIRRLANQIGFEFFVRNNTLYFRKPKDDKKGDITFELRKNIISFNPRMTTANLVNEVKATAWNDKDKERIEETARLSDIQSSVGIPGFDSIIQESQEKKVEIKLEGRVVRSRQEAKELAVAELRRRNRGFIEGTLECIGDPELRPGMTINIEKIGKRFSGVYYITKAVHTISDGGYKSRVEVRRSVF